MQLRNDLTVALFPIFIKSRAAETNSSGSTYVDLKQCLVLCELRRATGGA